MEAVSSATRIEDSAGAYPLRIADAALALALLVVAAGFFGLLFNRESVLSYAIGYNLYGAERVLEGEVPYRDFHTLYPPATVYVNAWIFKLLGISLYNALLGVMVFKVLTTVMLFLCGRLVMPRSWALAAAAFSLFWLRPNGPFKAVPMHYGALFLAVALFSILRYVTGRKRRYLVIAGLAIGVLALFKHNIGAYALIGSLVVVFAADVPSEVKARQIIRNYHGPLILLCAFVLPLAPALIYMKSQGALGPMVHTLLFGPGEFLLGRLNALPSPVMAVIFAAWLAMFGSFALGKVRSGPVRTAIVMAAAVLSISAFLLLANQSFIDSIVFYVPVAVVAAAGFVCFSGNQIGRTGRVALLAVLVGAAAAFMESFPRFAREQAISAMPFVVLLLFFLLYTFKPKAQAVTGSGLRLSVALGIVPLAFVLMGVRLFASTYFAGFKFKSGAELRAVRGRGVYFPESIASEIDEVIDYVQQWVPPDGYFFAHSYAGSSYLFLADRKNPSGVQFWGGVGVSDEEKARTLAAIKEKNVYLIITSDKDLAAEKFTAMRDYIGRYYILSKRIGDVVILTASPFTSKEHGHHRDHGGIGHREYGEVKLLIWRNQDAELIRFREGTLAQYASDPRSSAAGIENICLTGRN